MNECTLSYELFFAATRKHFFEQALPGVTEAGDTSFMEDGGVETPQKACSSR